jgi:hypothetical protein
VQLLVLPEPSFTTHVRATVAVTFVLVLQPKSVTTSLYVCVYAVQFSTTLGNASVIPKLFARYEGFKFVSAQDTSNGSQVTTGAI